MLGLFSFSVASVNLSFETSKYGIVAVVLLYWVPKEESYICENFSWALNLTLEATKSKFRNWNPHLQQMFPEGFYFSTFSFDANIFVVSNKKSLKYLERKVNRKLTVMLTVLFMVEKHGKNSPDKIC